MSDHDVPDDDDIEEVIELDDAPDFGEDGGEGVLGGQEEDDTDEEMEAVNDDAKLVFSQHKGSVFCCDLEPLVGNLAVTGGEDDRAFVWNITNGETLFECIGHQDSVICVSFSHDGHMAATGDMNGLIKVWEISSKSEIACFETADDLMWLQWHPGSYVLLAGAKCGDYWMWRIPVGDCKAFIGHGVATNCCKILADGKRTAVGYSDGSVRVWDLKSTTRLHSVIGDLAHKNEVVCIDGYHDNVLVLSGSTDGTAKLLNSSNGQVLATMNCVSKNNQLDEISVETVGFCPNFPVFATGTLAGYLTVWDISTQVQRHICQQEGGVVKLVWDRTSPMIYTAGLDGSIRKFDARNGSCVSRWTGHAQAVLDIALSRDGHSILSTSEDDTCRVFHVD